MGNPIFVDATSGAFYIFCVVTAPLCGIITGLRFLATYRSGRSIGWEDWFALGAFLTHFVHCVLGLIILELLAGRPIELLQPNEISQVGKLVYCLVPIFPINQFFAKFSILWLYNRLFAIKKSFKYSVWACGLIQIGYSLSAFIVSLFSCQPVSKGWNLLQPGKCINHSIFLAASETVNSTVDFAMVILAIYMIRSLKMKMSTKWKLGFIFGLGGAAGIVGFVKVGESFGDPGTASNLTSALWTTIQQACSVICCCAPIYRSLLPKKGLRKMLTRGSGSKTAPSKLSHSDTSTETIGRRATHTDQMGGSKGEAWLHLDGSSQRGLAWTEVDANPIPQGVGEPQYPSRTVQVQQNVEMV